jgi:hypothetical protein
MSANPNWARWVFASVATYLKQVAQNQQLPVLIEGLDERTTEFMNTTDRCEVRITGPFTREASHDYFVVEVVVNVLFVSRYEERKNQYAVIQKTGVFQEAMDGPIAVRKYGTGPEDDERALLGCLSPVQGRNDAIRVMHFGQITPTDRLKQSMVDARYRMELSTNQ